MRNHSAAKRAPSVATRASMACLATLCAAALAFACGDDDDEPNPIADPEGEIAPETPAADEETTTARAALARTRVHLDLLALSHLADVDHHGLYMDFGTPQRMHFTMGRWHGGFLRDVTAGDRDFTRIGTDARAFFHLDEARAITFRLRGRPLGSTAVVAYLNGQRVGQINFEGAGVQDQDLSIPASSTRAGENTLMLRSSETRSVQGEDVTAEIDSIWLLPEEPPAEVAAPRFTEMVREVTAGGQERRAITARAPTSVRFYAEIPPDGRLSFGASALGDGAAQARVTLTPEGGEATEVYTGEVTSEAWTDRLIDVSAHAGDVVRIDFEATGDSGAVAFSGPAVVVPLPTEALEDAEARSVIVLLIDTLRASKLRAYNPRSRVRTPALDAFAEEAAVFEHAQSPENWTKPSVASILTSLTPTTHNTKEQSSSLPESALMVSEVYQNEGFATGSFIANGYVSNRFGFDQGWDSYTNYIRDNASTEAEHVFDEALTWIEAHQEERFFAYIQTIDPHVPYDPPEAITETYFTGDIPARFLRSDGSPYNRNTGNLLEAVKAGREPEFSAQESRRLQALHDAEITYHDGQMERFIARLRELGIYDDVVFVVTSDHGEEFHEHGSWGHGHSIFQELLHVPLMVRMHGAIDPLRIGPTVSTMDIAPTILEATGVDIPEEFEGRSLLASARGHMRPGPAIAFSDKLDDRRVATAAGYKLVVRGNLTWAMFNLRDDPGEQDQIDRGSRHPIALRYLRGLMGQYLGAANRGEWLSAGDGAGTGRVLPQAESQIDAELCQQLQQLGYIDARCEGLL